jgi:integrase
MAERIRIHRENFENRKRQLENWRVPGTVKREILRFLEDLGLGKVNRGRKLSSGRQLHYLNGLRLPLEFLNKPTAQVKLRDIEDFEKALSSGQLRNKCTGHPYAHNTLVEFRKLLKTFMRWRLGTAKASALTNWLDIHYQEKTPDFLKEAEVERLYGHCREARQRFLIAVLFDTGARAEEFHNIRFEDVHLPEGKENFVKITLKVEYSKTLGRTITLLWRYSLEAVREYLAERAAEGVKPTDPVFRGDYTATRKFLQRLGQQVLQRPVHYHLFRHSSATYYADKMNRQQLCIRYGWKFGSPLVDTYISRLGVETKALEEAFTQTELGTLKDELVKVKQADKIKEERIRQLEESVRLLIEHFDEVSRLLTQNPQVGQVEAALRKKQAGRVPLLGQDRTST